MELDPGARDHTAGLRGGRVGFLTTRRYLDQTADAQPDPTAGDGACGAVTVTKFTELT